MDKDLVLKEGNDFWVGVYEKALNEYVVRCRCGYDVIQELGVR